MNVVVLQKKLSINLKNNEYDYSNKSKKKNVY